MLGAKNSGKSEVPFANQGFFSPEHPPPVLARGGNQCFGNCRTYWWMSTASL